MKPPPQFHHLGMLTRSIDDSVALYTTAFHYQLSGVPIEIDALQIRVCVLEHAQAPRLELVQPMDSSSSLGRMASSGVSAYHMGWLVGDLDQSRTQIEALNFHALEPFQSPLWNNAACQFLVGPGNELVELVEEASP